MALRMCSTRLQVVTDSASPTSRPVAPAATRATTSRSRRLRLPVPPGVA